jgi:hypothetical protein
MYKQVEKTYTYNGSGGAYNYPADWFPINVAGYDTIAITVVAPTGWIGTISFWGGANNDESSPALWSLNDAEDASLVSQIETVSGSTPSAFTRNYRGSVAGLAEFGFYFANPTTFVSVVGTAIKVSVGLYASAK